MNEGELVYTEPGELAALLAQNENRKPILRLDADLSNGDLFRLNEYVEAVRAWERREVRDEAENWALRTQNAELVALRIETANERDNALADWRVECTRRRALDEKNAELVTALEALVNRLDEDKPVYEELDRARAALAKAKP